MNKNTTYDDVAVDTLFGRRGLDWYFASTVEDQPQKDTVAQEAGETLTELNFPT